MDVPTDGIHILLRRTPIGRPLAVIMGLLLVVSAGFLVMTKDAEAVRIAFCTTANRNADELLHVSLLQQRPDEPLELRSGETEPDGCGEFQAVPRGRPVMIVVWAEDGFRTGSTGWVDPDTISGTLPIMIESQASPGVD